MSATPPLALSRRGFLGALGGALALPLGPRLAGAGAGPVAVFAAASLQGALDEAVAAWQAQGHPGAVISYAGSSLLARQVAAGAPAGLVMLANVAWMDWLEARGAIDRASRRALLGNALVLVAPAGGAPLELEPGALSARLGPEGRLATGMTEAVPVGIYGKAALQSLGLWDEAAARLAETDNTRAALALVARGEAPLGLVYASDAAAEPRVQVVAALPAASHPEIRYPAALTPGAGDAAASLLDWLAGPEAAAIFAARGFAPPPGAVTGDAPS